MIILRLTNNNNQVVDLQPLEDIDLRLDISAIENTEIGVSFGISSQEFSIAGDNAANQFFGNLYNLGATPAVALQNSVDCQVLTDGQEVFTGKLYIRNIVTDQEGYTIYNVVVVNETIDFKYRIQNLSLNDPKFDWSAYDHTFTAANVTGSWVGNLKSGSIVYPHVNYGQPEGDTTAPNYAFAGLNTSARLENTIDNFNTPLRLQDFKPAIKLKDVVDVIFAGTGNSGSIGYQYTSSFLNSSYFNNLYLLTTADDSLGPSNNNPISQSAWVYRSGSTQTTLGTATTTVDFNAKSYDNSNNYNLGTDQYTADSSGSYVFTAQLTYTIQNWTSNPNTSVNLRFTKNGSPIVASTATRFNPFSTTGSLLTSYTIPLDTGDTVGLQMFFSGELGKNLVAHPGELNTWMNVRGPATVLGGNVNIRQQFPDDLKALDVIQALIEKFNLVIEPIPNQPNLLRIEPYDDWTDLGTQVDWTNKVDRDTKFQISHPAIEQPRTIIFSDEEDDDYLNKYTSQTFGKIYGQYIYTADSDLPEGERRIGKLFASTPTTNIPNSTAFIIPHLCTKNIGANETYKPITFKPRLLYGIGSKTVESSAAGFSGSAALTGSYFLRDETGNVTRQTTWYQVSSLSEMPITGSAFDLHFNNNNQGKGAIPPYWSNVVPNGSNFITGSGDAFTTYWANYINGLYDVDARKLTCNVYLKPTEIPDIALNNKIFIDGQYYRINKINGANLTRRDSVEVELIKTVARKLTFPRRRVTTTTDIGRDVIFGGYNRNGTGRYVDYNTGATIEDENLLRQAAQLDGYRVYSSGSGTGSVVWNYSEAVIPALQQNIVGTNEVSVDSSKVSVIGSQNTVGASVSTVTAIGQYNNVEQNVTNAFVLGQENTIGQQAVNTHIIGGLGNYTSGSMIGTTIIGGSGSYAVNSDYSMLINGEIAAVRDSDYTTVINGHQNEVVINGSGHTVIGLNLEGGGLDLLNTRNNSNWLGDTYFGESIFRDRVQLECGDGTNISLTGSLQGQGRHENLYILNWSGLSPGTTNIQLPNAVNNDYENIVYQFQANNTFDGTTTVNFTGFSGQTLNGAATYSLSDAYDGVTFTTTGSGWVILSGASTSQASYLSAYNSSSITTTVNVSASVQLPSIDLAQNISVVSGSRITFDKAGVYDIQFSAQLVKTTATNAPIFIWIRKNGTDVAWTNTEYIVPGNANDEIVLAWNWYVEAQSGDYYEIMYVDQQGNVTFTAKTGTVGPDIPSWIVTVGSIGGGSAYISGSGGGGATFPYTGSAVITGSLLVTGSLRGNVTTMTITNNTASMDLSKGNAFYLFLNTASVLITGSNILPNQHVSLFVSQSGNNNLYFDNSFYFGTPYTASQTAGAKDILTFETYTVNPGAFLNTGITYNLVSQSGAPLPVAYPSASGGIEQISGSFRIHKFTSSADFTVHTTGSSPNNGFEVLVVAGGGGGGSRAGGGGGAGGVVYMTSSVSSFTAPTTYKMTVGAGGAGAIDGVTGRGASGNDSSITSSLATILIAKGGGGGGGYPYASDGDGGNGGSGGGGQSYSSTVTATETQTSQTGNSGLYGYGNDGAPATTAGGIGGGGGGAGVAPSGTPNADSYINGGDGIQVNISGSFYVGGGGGGGDDCVAIDVGLGGAGGGAAGGLCNATGNNATANTGGGGGGGGGDFRSGGNGGSGLIIVKYKYQA